jgi:archaellum component FlaC
MPAKKPKVTLDQFFDRFQAFENRVAIRFDQVEQNFKGEIARLEERIRNIDINLEKLTGDVETLTEEYHAIVAGLKRLESQVSELSEEAFSQLLSLKNRLTAVEDRVLALESP